MQKRSRHRRLLSFFAKQRDSPHPPGGDLCTVINVKMKNARITMRTNDKPGVEPARCPAHQKLLRLYPPPPRFLHTPLRLTDPLFRVFSADSPAFFAVSRQCYGLYFVHPAAIAPPLSRDRSAPWSNSRPGSGCRSAAVPSPSCPSAG